MHICATGAALTMYLKMSLFAHWIRSLCFTSCFITHMAHRAICNIEMLTGFCTGSDCYFGSISVIFCSLWYVCWWCVEICMWWKIIENFCATYIRQSMILLPVLLIVHSWYQQSIYVPEVHFEAQALSSQLWRSSIQHVLHKFFMGLFVSFDVVVKILCDKSWKFLRQSLKQFDCLCRVNWLC